MIVRVIMKHGFTNSFRKSNVGRIINFGVAAEYGQTISVQVKGQHFLKSIPKQEKQEFFYFLLSIGQLIWKCIRAMQVQASKPQLATDNKHDCKFAHVPRKYMIIQVVTVLISMNYGSGTLFQLCYFFPVLDPVQTTKIKRIIYYILTPKQVVLVSSPRTKREIYIYFKFLSTSELLSNHSSRHIIIMLYISSVTLSCIYTS